MLRQTKRQDPNDPPQQAPKRHPRGQVERAGREVRGGRIAGGLCHPRSARGIGADDPCSAPAWGADLHQLQGQRLVRLRLHRR